MLHSTANFCLHSLRVLRSDLNCWPRRKVYCTFYSPNKVTLLNNLTDVRYNWEYEHLL